MTAASSPERELARRLVTLAESECRAAGSTNPSATAAEQVFERLHAHLARSIGAEGFRALLARALDRSRSEHPLLASLSGRAEPDLPTQALTETLRAATPADATEALIALVAAFITLLGRFVGAGLAMRLVEQSWPEILHDDHARMDSGDEPHD